MDRRSFLISAGTALAAGGFASQAGAQQPAGPPEKPKVTLGVGGKPLLYYLPLTIAERRGFFKDEGLEVEINDFGGGAKSLQALIGGSVDVVTGAYEHTIRMQAKGQDVRAVMELGRFPAVVIAVTKDRAGEIKSAADLKGKKIGVTAPGSSTALIAQYAMVKAGLKPTDAALIGIGGGRGRGGGHEEGRDRRDLPSRSDYRQARSGRRHRRCSSTRAPRPAPARSSAARTRRRTLYAKKDFIDTQPEDHAAARERLHGVAEMARSRQAGGGGRHGAARVPAWRQAPLHPGGEELARKLLAQRPRSPEGMASVYDMLKLLDPELKGAQVDLANTFDDRFVKRAMG